MRRSQSRDSLSADTAGAIPTQEGSPCRARREAVACACSRSHPQEVARRPLPARLGDGRPRLLPALGTRQSSPSLQALGMGREEDKTSWGAQIVDYEKIATAALQAMKAADLNRFFVVCALVSDLYCPGYNPRQSLEKNSNLARTAARYKVDPAKVGAAARAELSKSKDE